MYVTGFRCVGSWMRVVSHQVMCHVTYHVNESCHTCWVMSHVLSRVAYAASCHIYHLVSYSRAVSSVVFRECESCHTHKWVMAHVWHGTRVPWLIHVCVQFYKRGVVVHKQMHTRDVTHLFTCVTSCVCMCVWHDSFMRVCYDFQWALSATWLICMCDMTHS